MIVSNNHLEHNRIIISEYVGTIDFCNVDSLDNVRRLDLTLGGYNVRNIENLASLTEVGHINMLNSDLDSIEFVRSMRNLNFVNFSHNNITDLTPLKDKPLDTVIIYNNKVSDISWFKDHKYIESLNYLTLTDNCITDYTALKYAVNLKHLDVDSITSEVIKALRYMPKLKSLNNNYNISDLIYSWKINKLIDSL